MSIYTYLYLQIKWMFSRIFFGRSKLSSEDSQPLCALVTSFLNKWRLDFIIVQGIILFAFFVILNFFWGGSFLTIRYFGVWRLMKTRIDILNASLSLLIKQGDGFTPPPTPPINVDTFYILPSHSFRWNTQLLLIPLPHTYIFMSSSSHSCYFRHPHQALTIIVLSTGREWNFG